MCVWCNCAHMGFDAVMSPHCNADPQTGRTDTEQTPKTERQNSADVFVCNLTTSKLTFSCFWKLLIVLMGVRCILFLTVFAHLCRTAVLNDNTEHLLVDKVKTAKPTDNIYPTDQDYPATPEEHRPAVSGRSFTIRRVYVAQTDEPIDYSDPSDEMLLNGSSTPDESSKEKIFLSFSIKEAHLNDRHVKHVTHLCNSTKLGVVTCNRTPPALEIFNISNEAELFLKGPLVTRAMPSFYIFLFLVCMPLNALAFVTFTCKIRAKKPAVIYMSHLACVDLLFTLLLPLKIHYHLNGSDWLFGEVACRVVTSVYYCYMYCSILLMMCMSVDRFVAVVLPVASLSWRSAKNAMFICVLVWLLALAGTVPLLSMKQTFKIKNVGVTCHDALHHDDPEEQQYVYVFFILSCLYYFLPLVVTLVSYSSIIYVLCTKPDRLTTSSSSSNKRRRAVIMAIAVLVEFVVCFASTNGILLYHCVLLAMGGHSEEGDSSYTVYMLAVCAGSSSVLLDPLLYYYGSSQCRQQIGSLFWWRKKAKRGATLSSSNTRTKSSHLNCDYSKAQIKV